MKLRVAMGSSMLLLGSVATTGQVWALPGVPFLWNEGTMEREARLVIENCLTSPTTCLLPATVTTLANLTNKQLVGGFTEPLNGGAAANAETIDVYFGSVSDLLFMPDCDDVYRAFQSDYKRLTGLQAPEDVNYYRCTSSGGPGSPMVMFRRIRPSTKTIVPGVVGGLVEKISRKHVSLYGLYNYFKNNDVRYHWSVITGEQTRPVTPLLFKDMWVPINLDGLIDTGGFGNMVSVNVPVFDVWKWQEVSISSRVHFVPYPNEYFSMPLPKMLSRITLSCKDKVTGVLHEISSPISSPGVTGIDGSAYFRTSRTDLTANTELNTLQKNCDTINVGLNNVRLLDKTSDASITVTFTPPNAEAHMWEAYAKLLAESVTDRTNIVGLLNPIALYTGDQRSLILTNMAGYSSAMQFDFTTWAASKGYVVNLADYFITNSSDPAMNGVAIYSLNPDSTPQGMIWGEFVNDLSFPINSERDMYINVLNSLLAAGGSTLSAVVATQAGFAQSLLDNELGKANYFMTQLVPLAQIGYSKTLCATSNEIKSHLPPPQTYQTCT
ncbi:MAG: hypothetical protein HY273_15335 [Gammaproteobacteria bacterium]|nr:hypothetical protein [Gammaproteobacteria bacterium]